MTKQDNSCGCGKPSDMILLQELVPVTEKSILPHIKQKVYFCADCVKSLMPTFKEFSHKQAVSKRRKGFRVVT